MARNRRDDDDDYDDDEYVPRKRRDRDEGGSSALLLFGGLGLVVLAVIAVAFFVIGGRRDAAERAVAEERAVAQAAQNFAPVPMQPNDVPKKAAEPVWPRLIGTWARQPAAKDDNSYPYLFVFREDRTGSMTRINYDGKPIQQDITVEILSDSNNTLRAGLLVHMGRYGYNFTLQPDGTMLFDDGKDGLVFRRQK